MKISFDEFKRRVLADYKEVVSGKEIAHVILEKFTETHNDISIEKGFGPMFDAIYNATVQHSATVFIWWNNHSNKQTNSDILKMLSGFTSMFKNKALSVQTTKSNDYASLCITLEKQFNFTKATHSPSVTIIDLSDDSASAFKKWIIEKEICSEQELNEIKG